MRLALPNGPHTFQLGNSVGRVPASVQQDQRVQGARASRGVPARRRVVAGHRFRRAYLLARPAMPLRTSVDSTLGTRFPSRTHTAHRESHPVLPEPRWASGSFFPWPVAELAPDGVTPGPVTGEIDQAANVVSRWVVGPSGTKYVHNEPSALICGAAQNVRLDISGRTHQTRGIASSFGGYTTTR